MESLQKHLEEKNSELDQAKQEKEKCEDKVKELEEALEESHENTRKLQSLMPGWDDKDGKVIRHGSNIW